MDSYVVNKGTKFSVNIHGSWEIAIFLCWDIFKVASRYWSSRHPDNVRVIT